LIQKKQVSRLYLNGFGDVMTLLLLIAREVTLVHNIVL